MAAAAAEAMPCDVSADQSAVHHALYIGEAGKAFVQTLPMPMLASVSPELLAECATLRDDRALQAMEDISHTAVTGNNVAKHVEYLSYLVKRFVHGTRTQTTSTRRAFARGGAMATLDSTDARVY